MVTYNKIWCMYIDSIIENKNYINNNINTYFEFNYCNFTNNIGNSFYHLYPNRSSTKFNFNNCNWINNNINLQS